VTKPTRPTAKPLPTAGSAALGLDLRKLADFVPAMIGLYNVLTNEYVYANKAVTKLLGYRPKEFLDGGMAFVSSLVHPDDLPVINRQNQRAIQKIQAANRTKKISHAPIVSFEYRMRHKKGHYVWLQTDGSIYNWAADGSTIEHVINVSVDITERKLKEAELQALTSTLEERIKERSERLEVALDASRMGIWEWDITTNKLVWSYELKKLFGLKPTDPITYAKYQRLLHPEDRERARRIITQAMETGKPYAFEHRIIWPDKSQHWIYGMGRAIRKNGRAIRMIGGSINIDERKDIELQVLDSEERYQAFIENSQEGIWRIEIEKPIQTSLTPKQQINRMYKYAYLAECNHAMARMYGYGSPEPLIGARLGDLLVKGDPKNTAYLEAFIASGYNLTGIDSHEKDRYGNDRYFRNSMVGIVKDGILRRAWGTQQDVTEQSYALQRLEESERRFRSMADSAPVFIWEAGPNTLCTYFNKYWLDYTGHTLAQEIGEGWKQSVHPDDLKRCVDIYETAYETKQPFSQEYRLRRHDGVYHWILDRGVPRFSPTGKFLGFIGSCVDIEQLKHTEELEEATELLRLQRADLLELNRAKDEFISLASHQLRTPATGVKQYLGILLEGFLGNVSSDQMHMLSMAYGSNERQLNIIDDLLRVAHVDAGQINLHKTKANVVQIAQDVVNEQASRFKDRKQKVTLKSSHKQITVLADHDKLRMVLENIVDNASKYTPPGKAIIIQVQKNKSGATIQVTDRGVGIAKKDMSKLFKKFSRIENALSTTVGGTGLGLYWAKKIIDLHGGSIAVVSQSHKGTTFSITIP
jgi:PAS domain S-box-containing protein